MVRLIGCFPGGSAGTVNRLENCICTAVGKILIPGGRDCVEIGDTVVVVTTNKGMNDFKDILA